MPDVQLDFLTNNIQFVDQWADEVKLKYIQLLAELEKERLVSFLSSNILFPLDPALEVCKKCKHLGGIAYLQLRLGLQEEAVIHMLQVESECHTVTATRSV